MKSIFLSGSDEEAIKIEFIKLNDKTNDNQKKEGLWEQLAATRNLPVKTQIWQANSDEVKTSS